MIDVDRLFCSELKQREIEYRVLPDGLYAVRICGHELTVSLENLRRNVSRDGDPQAVARFVESLGSEFDDAVSVDVGDVEAGDAEAGDAEVIGDPSDSMGPLPTWTQVRPFVRYSLEPTDYETGFDDVLTNPISDELTQVYVYTNADGSRITWINESSIASWGVEREQVQQQAEVNMSTIVTATELQIEDIDGNLLGMLSTEEVAFKASLILSTAFRRLVEPSLGWPVYVVVPCRDFAYVVRHDNPQFLGRLGAVVVKEFYQSGYSITKDVLEISDRDVRAIGTFPDPE